METQQFLNCPRPAVQALFVALGLLSTSLGAQPTTDANRKTAHAVRADHAPHLDGELDDACWQQASVAGDFVTNSPIFGKPAAEKTEVRIVYTDEAVYVGAYLYQQAASIRTDLSKRDVQSTADQFHVGFDTYIDRQNAFRFEVTAAGVQRDLRMSPNSFDPTWDAVWEVKVKVHDDGWVVEMRIPFSAMRFAKKPQQVWGFQMARQIQYLNEFSSWSPVDPNGGGALPQWGNLDGLHDINPPLRLAFSPYLAASVQRSPVSDSPVSYANSRSVSGGMDVKWGINESFTLDATLVPNFGEAQSDNTVRNLSPFEVQYEERRQFFTEGTELFSKGDVFYSRRIGGRPPGFFTATDALGEGEALIKNPSEQALYNATKFSGRTKSKFGIGILNAVAAPAQAVIRDETTGATRKLQTAPLSNYNVLVLDQLLANNSSLAFTNTSVLREGAERDANVSAFTFNLRDPKNKYELFGENRLSAVWTDGSAKPVTGFGYRYGFRQVSGKWMWTFLQAAVDDHYDQRDLALNRRNNFASQFFYLSKGNYEPRGKILSSYWEATVENTLLASPQRWESLEFSAYGEFQNQRRRTWSLFMLSRPIWYWDYFEPRVPGKKYHHAPFIFFNPGFQTDLRRKLNCRFGIQYGESPIPRDPFIGISAIPTWVLSDHVILRGEFRLQKDHSNFGAVNWDEPANVIFGRRDITTFDNQMSIEHLFGPRMNASIRARHYWAQLYYHEYLHLNDDGSFGPTDWNGTADENFNQFNVDFVYTWQFAPGSFLNLIWKDAIFVGDDLRRDGFFRNFRKTMQAPQDNTITLKLIYWLDAGTF